MNDDFLFAGDGAQQGSMPAEQHATAATNSWKILVADDEPEVHQVTNMVLRDFRFDGMPVNILSAHSGAEAKVLLREHPDIALALLDVVMEEESSGLDLVRFIREEQQNFSVRIVLRTGQPGQAPEESVIRDYDINDYKNKTELTSIKLKTLLYAALRAYRDIIAIERNRAGLERAITAIGQIFESNNLVELASAVLTQITGLLGLEGDAVYCNVLSAVASREAPGKLEVLAATPNYFLQTDRGPEPTIPREVQQKLRLALGEHHSLNLGDQFVGYYTTRRGSENVLYVKLCQPITSMDYQLLDVFSHNVAVAYESILLRERVRDTQSELSYILGESMELRSRETGGHVKRMAHMAYILAKAMGFNEDDCQVIKLAAPLHDIGKVAIPDAVLHKPGKLDPAEWEVMKSHAMIGHDMLCSAKSEVLRLGAVIAAQHHEHWDGSGYPNCLVGEEIDPMSRIVAVADVFDSLGSKRCYKEPWPHDRVIAFMDSQAGKQFDPEIISVLHQEMDAILRLREEFPDPA